MFPTKKTLSAQPRLGHFSHSQKQHPPVLQKMETVLTAEGFLTRRPQAALVAQLVKNPPAVWETWVPSLG